MNANALSGSADRHFATPGIIVLFESAGGGDECRAIRQTSNSRVKSSLFLYGIHLHELLRMDANSHWQMFSEQIPAHAPSDRRQRFSAG